MRQLGEPIVEPAIRPIHIGAGGSLLPGGSRPQFTPFTMPAFLSADECADLVDLGRDGMAPARLSGGHHLGQVRSAQTLWLDDARVPRLGIKLARLLSHMNDIHFGFDVTGFDEGYLLLRYDGGDVAATGDFYDWHIDIGHSGTSQSRKITMIIQLSDQADYEGGVLEVNANGAAAELSQERGTLLAFPSFSLHRVSPVMRGRRYSLAIWAHGPAFR